MAGRKGLERVGERSNEEHSAVFFLSQPPYWGDNSWRWDALFLACFKPLGNEQSSQEAVWELLSEGETFRRLSSVDCVNIRCQRWCISKNDKVQNKATE